MNYQIYYRGIIYYFSQSIFAMTQHKIYDDKSKHIHRRHTIPLNNLSLIEFYVKSKDNIADPLIKDL